MTHLQAMLCGLAGFFLWVVVDTAIKYTSMGQEALSPFVILAALGLFGSASLALVVFIKRKTAVLRPHSRKEQITIAITLVLINYANVVALKHIPLTMFYVVVFTIPLMIAILSVGLKHEVLTIKKIACLIAGFGGTALAIGIKGGGGDWIGYVAAFASVTCFAVYTVLLRKIAKTDSVESTQFLAGIFIGIFGLLGLIFEPTAMPNLTLLAIMIVAGCLNTLGGVMYNVGIQNTVSTNVAQLHYTQIIFGAIFGYFLWHEVPTLNLVIGSIIIVICGMIVAADAHRNETASKKS